MAQERRKLSATQFVCVLICAATLACGARAQAQGVAPGCGGDAVSRGEAARVVDGRSFVAADGREVRLAGIETLLPVPGDEDEARVAAALAARTALEKLVLHREVVVRSIGADRYGRLIGYPMLKPHDLRHGVAMEVYEQHHDLEQVRGLLGHTRIETTQLYAQIRPAALKHAVEFYEAKALDVLSH